MAKAENRALISLPFGRLLWWTPGTFPVDTIATDAIGKVADLTAEQYAAITSGDLVVRGLFPPDDAVAFQLEPDRELGGWSLDDSMIAGTGEIEEPPMTTGSHVVRRASDGETVLTVIEYGPARITWESDSSVLILAMGSGVSQPFQWIRCSLTGTCQRVGRESASLYDPLVLATRRNA